MRATATASADIHFNKQYNDSATGLFLLHLLDTLESKRGSKKQVVMKSVAHLHKQSKQR